MEIEIGIEMVSNGTGQKTELWSERQINIFFAFLRGATCSVLPVGW